MEALGGVLKAKMSQDSVKMGPRTRQERNPRELPSGLELQGRWKRALKGGVGGRGGPGLNRAAALPEALGTTESSQGHSGVLKP